MICSAELGSALKARFPVAEAKDFVFTSTPPAIERPFPDVTFLSVHFSFNTRQGPSFGLANLVWEDMEWKAWTCFTLLEGIHGHPQVVGAHRKRGTHNDTMSYDERRVEECEFKDMDPQVLIGQCGDHSHLADRIVGGGHNGLALAAQLNTLGVHNLVIDKQKRVGDNWRLRYRSATLSETRPARY